MTVVKEGIASEPTKEFTVEDTASPSVLDSVFGWFSETVGTYAAHQRDQFFAREGISSGAPSDTVERDSNAKGDIAGKAEIVQPFYKNPYVIAGGAAVTLLVGFLIFKR